MTVPIDENYVLNFGKHKGARLIDIPSDYLEWLLKGNFLKAEGKYASTNVAISRVIAKIISERRNGSPEIKKAFEHLRGPAQPAHPPEMTFEMVVVRELRVINKKLDNLSIGLGFHNKVQPTQTETNYGPDEDVPF